MNIINYLSIHPYLTTSGQPAALQFSEMAALGYETVINIALTTSDKAIANEGEIVTSCGMNYVHIPVEWESPKIEQYELFCAVMQAHQNKMIWVHCAMNMRVSCFVFLYNIQYCGYSEKDAEVLMTKVWQPNQIWSDFIEQVKTKI